MARKAVVAIVAVAVIGLLALTNPKMEDFKSYLKQEILKSSTRDPAHSHPILGGLVASLVGATVDSVTTRDNFVIGSLYTVQLGSKHAVFLGALGLFFKVSGDS